MSLGKLSEFAKKSNLLSELQKKLKRLREREKKFDLEKIRFDFVYKRLVDNYDRENKENEKHCLSLEELRDAIRALDQKVKAIKKHVSFAFMIIEILIPCLDW